MKHLKTFRIFESEGSPIMTPEMKRLADSMMVGIDVVVETDRDKLSEWVIEQGLQLATDEYLDSDEFREFTEASVEETDEYRERVQSGEDPEKVLQQLTDKAVSDQTYWSEFLEDGGYDVSAMEEVQGDINYLTPNGKPYYFTEPSRWEEVPGTSIPTIDIEGQAEISDYQGSFLPFRIRDVAHGNFLPGDVMEEFQTDYVETTTGEFTFYRTRLIAIDKGPMDVDFGFFITTNPRLISLEGIRHYDNLELEDNGLDESILKRSLDLTPGSRESIEYYQSLLQMPEFSNFDDEQIQFVLERIGHNEGIQKYIDENPEKMAVSLKSVWKKIKSIDKFRDLHFPENLKGEVDLMSDLHDIGL
jgi:hypothetical protein